jgi:YHS domain-containing protein
MKAVDPVCKMKVSTEDSVSASYKGSNYYFCSDECKSEFIKNPEKYVSGSIA